MFKFDVSYEKSDYLDYYKYILITKRLVRNLVLSGIFLAIAIWFFLSDKTNNYLIPILSILAAVCFPLINFIMIPLLKKQLDKREEQIKAAKIVVTFNEDEIIYENNTLEMPKEEVKEEVESIEENGKEAEEVVEEKEVVAEENKEDSNEKVFHLKYINFYEIRETKDLFLFALDLQTMILLPKRSIVEGNIEDFKAHLVTKMNPKRLHLKK